MEKVYCVIKGKATKQEGIIQRYLIGVYASLDKAQEAADDLNEANPEWTFYVVARPLIQ